MNTFSLLVLLFTFFVGGLSFLRSASPAQALDYSGGTYINLCGSGTAATANSCNRGCNTNTGSCAASGNTVVKYTCDGRNPDCRSNESTFSTSHSVGSPGCGKTVQIDVFNKTCRVNGQWVCSDSDLQDYIVWYSGDCKESPAGGLFGGIFRRPSPRPTPSPSPLASPTPWPTPTPVTQVSRCEGLEVVSGNDSLVPATVTLRARGSDNRGTIQNYRFYFGDGIQQESANPEIQHKYEVSGTFRARVDIKDSQGNWKTAPSCETNVRVQASPVESHKAGCSDISLSANNNAVAPSTVTARVNGYDNKGSIQEYRLDFGNGVTRTSTDPTFNEVFTKAGTYTVRGYVKNSAGQWVGGENGCRRSVYINTDPLTKQPETGTPTLFSILGIGSGVGGAALQIYKRKFRA